ncbi:hypothetical protein VTL71DRAFT_14946 [Oculimacula yallundae]|uniref:Uncharacterized protein n=1 Tax=Oculimacula yallundae TaxID=86028 RepID=A0ABR4CF73_9HELO
MTFGYQYQHINQSKANQHFKQLQTTSNNFKQLQTTSNNFLTTLHFASKQTNKQTTPHSTNQPTNQPTKQIKMSALSTALFLNHPENDAVFSKMSTPATSPVASPAQSQRSSVSSDREVASTHKNSAFSKIGRKIAKAAKEHHKSVNSAFTAYYGLPIVERK